MQTCFHGNIHHIWVGASCLDHSLGGAESPLRKPEQPSQGAPVNVHFEVSAWWPKNTLVQNTLFYTFFLWCSSLSKGMVRLFGLKNHGLWRQTATVYLYTTSIQQSILVPMYIQFQILNHFFGKYAYYLHKGVCIDLYLGWFHFHTRHAHTICIYMLLIKFLVAFKVFGTCYQRGYYHHNN